MASPKPKTKPQSPLLATTTNEPFQPVRIYFAVPDADALMAKLQTLACMNVDPTRNCLEWLFDQESASLPREGEMVLERAFKSLKTREGMLQFFKESQIGEDVPLVEDLQLNPEEETPAFDTLATTLNLRAIRAWEHWQGHTDVTLGSLIRKATEPGKKQTRRA
jgi:hypothetical protein